MGNFQYFGLFLDEETKKGLLDVFLTYLEEGNSIGYLMNKIYLDHCTLLHVSQLHGNSEIYNYLNDRIGEKYEIVINGIGISEDELPKIFGRFYKCKTTQQEEGVGLGLYLAREIISGQGGYIKVSSQIGQGTVFSVFLRNVI